MNVSKEKGQSNRFGGHSMVAPLRRVMVRSPDSAFAVADPDEWHYRAAPDLSLAQAQHGSLVSILEELGIEVTRHDRPLPELADSLFVHDPALVTDGGTIKLRMGKPQRRGEETPLVAALEGAGVPNSFSLAGEACAEGGDLLWLDETTLAVGLGFRTNRAGLKQLEQGLENLGVSVLPVELPVGDGPDSCLHLQSLISLLDSSKALVFSRLLPVSFYRELLERDFRLIEVDAQELATLGANVLALEPGLCVAVDGNPVTRRRLERAGVEVRAFAADAICLLAEGGPTCLTRPIWREL